MNIPITQYSSTKKYAIDPDLSMPGDPEDEHEQEDDPTSPTGKYKHLWDRLKEEKCLMCGGETEEYTETGPDEDDPSGAGSFHYEKPPVCLSCAQKDIPEDVEEFLTANMMDYYQDPMEGHEVEVPTDPKEIEETYRRVEPEELSSRTGPIQAKERPPWPAKLEELTKEYKRNKGLVERSREPISAPDWVEQSEPGSYRPLDASIIKDLVKIANTLDSKGLYEEANSLDEILKSIRR